MQKVYFTLLLAITFNFSWAQSDNCSGAITLTNGTCVTGSSAGFTQNIVGCVGNADDDAWYKFVASATSHSVTVTGSASFDAVLQLFSGTCAALASSGCVDNTFNGQSESMIASGLTIGSTYYVRVYNYGAGSGSSTFTMCLANPPAAPANNNCAGAINLAVNAGCINTLGTSYGATQSLVGCSGDANDDVWYSFSATNYTQTIQVSGSAAMDPVVELFDGTCASFTSMSCTDITFSGGIETVTASGLTPGVTYFFRVYDYYSTSGNSFSVCVSGNSIVAGSQPNDEPCSAIMLPAVTADCNVSNFSNIGATLTSSGLAPNPIGCTGGTGGFVSGTKDVWFSIIVPANGNICITPRPNMGAGWITDGVMALYTGPNCSALTLKKCSDDADGTAGIYNYPGTANDFLPYLNDSNLVPGSIVYLRYWGWGSATGNFGLCVSSPTNDKCANALYICDLNGYSSSTNSAYTSDWPSNMKGDAETTWNPVPAPGKYNFVPGNTASGGIFGLAGTWGVGQPYVVNVPCVPYVYDVQIDNNSWVKFTAASTSASFSVTVSDCWLGGCKAGIQMQIFSAVSACTTFTPVSDYRQSASSFNITANSLVVGQDYYMMVDGWGGDICNYNIKALTGVSLPGITAAPGTICPGNSTILTAPNGATGYTWQPTGETTQAITVAPGTQMTYSCFVGGVCGQKQTLTKTVFLYNTPTITFNTLNPTICKGKSVTLTAGSASTYTWTGGITNGVAFSPTITNTYSVTATSVNGCTNTAVNTVSVNPTPTVSSTVSNSVICNGGSTILNGTGASSYVWTGGVTDGVSFNPTTTKTYTVTGTDATTGCTNTAVRTVTVNAIPTTTVSTAGTITCTTPTINLNSTAVAGVSYTWTAPGSSSIFGGTANNQNAIGQGAGTYTLNVLSANCTYSATLAANINTTTPSASATGGTLTCTSTSTVLTGSPTSGVTYNWSGPGISGSTTSANVTATVVGSYSLITTNILSGCSSTAPAVATVTNNLTTPTVSAGSNQMITCSAPTVTLTGSATAGSSLSWLNNGATTSTTTASGAAFYTLTATNPGSGCSNSSTVQVTASPGSPNGTVAAVSNSITCTNTNVAVSITSTCTPITILWTGPNITGSTTTPSTTVSQGGTYTVTLTYTTTNCSVSYPVFVPTNTAPVAASASIAATSSITCNTNTVILGSNPQGPNFTYSWSGPSIISGGTTATPVVGATGNYSVTVTNTITGCTNTLGSAGVFVPTNTTAPLLSVSNNSITTTCGSPNTTVTASSNSDPNSTYTWTAPGTGTIDNINLSTPLLGGSGVFTVVVTNTINGCVSAIKTVTITPDVNTPTYNLGSNTATITCANPSPSVTLTSTVSGVTYSWSPTPSSGITAASPTFTATGNYTCIITATNGCFTVTAVAVGIDIIAPSLTVTPSVSITCASNTVIVTSTVNPVSTYTWSGTGIVGSINSSSIIANVIGDYTLTVTNPVNGCTTTAIASVGTNTVAPTLTLAATSTVITCSTTSSTLTASSSITDTPTWLTPSGGSATNTVIATASGDYTATIVDGTNGCKTSKTINITNNVIPPNANAGASVVMPCRISTATLSGTSTTTDPFSYSWSGPNATSITSATNISSPTVTNTGVYTLTVTNLVTGCIATSTVNVTQNNVTANFTADPMTGEAPLTVNFTDASIGATSYTWSFGNGGTSTNQNPNTIFNTAGTYTVVLIASSTSCSDTVSKTIIVEDGFTIEIPNVFTPNGDGANDAFHIKITGVKSAEGSIYNRWGQILYNWDALNVSWDGKGSNGEICPDATYYYLIKVIDKKGKEHIAPGYVLIIR